MLSRMSFSTDQFLDAMKEELSVILSEAEASGSGRMMNVGLHPHVSGRAYRVRAIRDFLSYAKSLDGVWFATREEIAEWYLQNNAGHIV
jgi:peptidoglycan/xylan/chitin deacetylase (PgdA/CDA1 family)